MILFQYSHSRKDCPIYGWIISKAGTEAQLGIDVIHGSGAGMKIMGTLLDYRMVVPTGIEPVSPA